MTEHDKRKRRLIEATTRCPACKSFCYLGDEHPEAVIGREPVPLTPCQGCRNPRGIPVGHVPLLGDAVRVQCAPKVCPCTIPPFDKSCGDGVECPSCHGLGYKPSNDPMVWLEAVAMLLRGHIAFQRDSKTKWIALAEAYGILGKGPTPMEALLDMTEQALIVGGVIAP